MNVVFQPVTSTGPACLSFCCSSGSQLDSGPERHCSAGGATQAGNHQNKILFRSLLSLTPNPSMVPPSADRGYGTCEIDWAKATYSSVYRSYIISIFIFCFFIPVLIMLFCYISIINTVKRGNALSAEGDLTDHQRKIERDVTIVSLYLTQFIVSHASAIANRPATKPVAVISWF